MVDLVDVEVEDVEPVALRRRPQPHVPAHAARPDERGIEDVDRHVRRADEIDLQLPRLRRPEAQLRLADPARDDVGRVQECVHPVRRPTLEERRVVDAVHHDEQLVQRELTHAAAHHPGHELLHDPAQETDFLGPALRRTGLEQPVAPGSRLQDQVLTRVERAVRSVKRVVLEAARRRTAHPADRTAAAERRAAHADRVDLVDEDDALAAPLRGQPLRLPGEVADDDGVHAHEGLLEP